MRPSGSHDEVDGSELRRFEALFHQNADTVMAYATRRIDLYTAQEVVAETFAVAWRRLDIVPDPALPWLLGVARKLLANERRSRGRAEALTVRLVREPFGSSDDPADIVDARLSVQAAVDELPPAEREVLELLAWEGLSAAQAAEALGCSRVAIVMRMHRARRRLHLFLDRPLEGQAPLIGHHVDRTQTDQISRASRMKEADDAS